MINWIFIRKIWPKIDRLLCVDLCVELCDMYEPLWSEVLIKRLILKMGQPPASFVNFVLFKGKFYRKTVVLSAIRTWIVRVEGLHSDYLTTTATALFMFILHENSSAKVVPKWCNNWELIKVHFSINSEVKLK